MIKNKITLAIVATLFASSVTAASLDARQEYKHGSESWASRIKIGGSVDNHFFGVEMKQKGKPFSEWAAAGSEFEYGYKFKIDEHWLIQPSMPISFGSDSITYKPQVRVQYAFDSGVKAKLRYRHEFRDYTSGSSNENKNRSKVTGNIDYNWNAWQFGFEANYAEDFANNEWTGGGGADNEWDYNMKVGYKEADWNWRPYVEFGNVQDSRDRQLRSRVGITYSF
ncbi:oligogalacturonate-specific porin KdgM family protein [Vibrio artabrorum]|uniref:oligogalacturonate-specific porin KdgM family protein n=1 Tax=Vibrio artabrorum TaxID=446374 RepID=UPI0035529972